jgi:RNA polymerase sigma-70 factor (ECF subfamily)
MFMCCHPALPREARVVLTRKVVAGLGTGEVARGLLTTTNAIAQRLVRAKRTLRDLNVELVLPRADELPARAPAPSPSVGCSRPGWPG